MSADDTTDPTAVTDAGRRLLRNPNRNLVRKVYDNDYERYRACVVANFPGCDRDPEVSE